jgi:hypothetical protein
MGSAREIKGRTGFAHLFEHLLSLNWKFRKRRTDKMRMHRWRGCNGSTSRDRTNYFQTVPRCSFEKTDLGWSRQVYFINTVTEPVLAKEKQVVKNEKRQSYDTDLMVITSVISKIYIQLHILQLGCNRISDLQNATLMMLRIFTSAGMFLTMLHPLHCRWYWCKSDQNLGRKIFWEIKRKRRYSKWKTSRCYSLQKNSITKIILQNYSITNPYMAISLWIPSRQLCSRSPC